jgi:uncharacterized membrane protein
LDALKEFPRAIQIFEATKRRKEKPMARSNGLTIIGAALVVVGILGLAIPVFTTQTTEEVARIGDLRIQNTDDTTHRIPPMLAGGVLLLGVVLVGASLYQRG